MSEEPRCCTGTPMAENIEKDGYCCAKPTDEELVEAQEEAAAHNAEADARWPCRETCEQADIPMYMTLEERGQQFAGGAKRALAADMIIRLCPNGTYHILKNRGRAYPLRHQACVVYVGGENIIPFPSLSDQAESKV